jgi:predicted outer membrane protein
MAKVQKLTKEKPDKFEKEFFKDLSKETKQTTKLFESAKTLQDADIKKFAEDWTVTIKGHETAMETAEKQAAKKK